MPLVALRLPVSDKGIVDVAFGSRDHEEVEAAIERVIACGVDTRHIAFSSVHRTIATDFRIFLPFEKIGRTASLVTSLEATLTVTPTYQMLEP